MADVNINFGSDENLDKLKKDLQDILKLVKDIKKSDIVLTWDIEFAKDMRKIK